MPEKTLATFKVRYLHILDENGNVDEVLKPKLKPEELRRAYEYMVMTRLLDKTILALQREGRMGTYASSEGQEATQVGSAMALKQEDWMVPYFRELGAHLVRGFSPDMYMQYWAWDERGQKIPENLNNFTISVPVSTQIPHAVGIAWGAKLKGDKIAVLVYFGDGATSKGDFNEGLNFAGTFKVPLVAVCQNNQWAISVPRKRQSAAETLAQKAIAFGFEGVQVDGNDVLAVFKATHDALEKARKGGGPTLIECFTYRIGDHTTSDDAKKYRSAEEVEAWRKRDPIERLKKYLQKIGIWSEDYEKKLQERVKAQIDEAVKKMESAPAPKPDEMFDYMYDKLPPHLEEQKKKLLDEIAQAKAAAPAKMAKGE